MKRLLLAPLILFSATWGPPALAAGFGIGFGAPLEERVGGDYGPEYYRNMQAQKAHGTPGHCRTRTVATPAGRKRVRRCS
jgi:hypothetical protein